MSIECIFLARRANASRIISTADKSPLTAASAATCETLATLDVACDWKLIDGLGSGGFTEPSKREPGNDEPTAQLYNLSDDLGETSNVYKDRPDTVIRLRGELDRIEKSANSRTAGEL